MKKIAGKAWVKVLCAFIAAIFAASAVMSLAAVVILSGSGAYSGADAGDVAANLMRSRIYDDMSRILGYCSDVLEGNSDAASYYENVFSSDNSNLCFTATNAAGEVIVRNYTGSGSLAAISGSRHMVDDETVIISAYVREDLSAYDQYRQIYDMSQWIFTHRSLILAALCVSAALFLALMIFLTGAAGRREGTDEIAERWVDRVPCDLFIAAELAAVTTVLCIAADTPVDTYGTGWYLMYGAGAAVCSLLITVFCMSWSVRFRRGGWWRGSIIFKCLMLIKKPFKWFLFWIKKHFLSLRELIISLPLVWRSALAAVGIFVLELIAFIDRSGFLWFIINAAVVFGIMFASADGRKLRETAAALAAGSFENRLDTSKMHWEFKTHGEDLNRIGDGIALAVDRQMKSERMKTELITNVSHDIKTPLTSIINYVDLLKKEDIQPAGAKEYINVLDRQSQRLRKLTEDVIEASKASTGNIPVELCRTDMNVLISQAAGEYEDKLSDQKLELVLSISDEPIFIMADGRLLWRVFDNLMGNAVKYALPGTRVYVSSAVKDGRAEAVFKNISASQLNISADELMERFTRGDASRSTEGSGLGLSIADSLTELQNGSFGIDIDGDLFKVKVSFDLCRDGR